MKKDLLLLLPSFLLLSFVNGVSIAEAAPTVDSLTGPGIITEGDEGVINFTASNAGSAVICDVIGGSLTGVIYAPPTTSYWNVNSAHFALYGTYPPGVSMSGGIRVKPTVDTVYTIDCQGASGGHGPIKTVTVLVEGMVQLAADMSAVSVGDDGLGPQAAIYCDVGGSYGAYCCISGGYFWSTKSISSCSYSFAGNGPYSFYPSTAPNRGQISGPGTWSTSQPNSSEFRISGSGFFSYSGGAPAGNITVTCQGVHRPVSQTGPVKCYSASPPPPPPPTSPTLNLTVRGNANGVTASNGGVITIPNGTSATLSWTTTNATSCMAVTSVPNETWNSGGVTNNSSGVSVGPLATRSTAYRYTLWCSGGGGSITQTVFVNVSAPLTVTVSGRIYNQTTGIGYGAASGVKIAACGSNPGAVVNADGTYSFQVPVGPAFCIRLTDASGNPFVPTGASGSPKTVFTDPVRSWVSSYEHQVGGQDCTTGSHCGDPVTSPDDGPSLWDRAVDTGYDFVYTSIPAIVDLKANGGDSLTIQNNSPVTLTWSTSNVVTGSCSASGEWSGAKADNNASGESRGNLSTGTHTFVLTCREQGTNAPISDTVQVTSINPPCTPNGCEANTCIPKTCNNGCGVLVPGTRDCREHWQEVAP